MVEYLHQRYMDKLFWDDQHLTFPKLKFYKRAILWAGGIPWVWGWVDGTLRATCWPSTVDQSPLYSSYKKVNAFKFQGIVTPDGLISSLAGPVEGSIGDWRLWKVCGHVLSQHVLCSECSYFHGYVDYYGSFRIMGEFCASSNVPLSQEQWCFNT